MPSDGLRVVSTDTRPPGTPGRRPYRGWTLHVPGCEAARRAGPNALPAPEVPYANTVPCGSCRPDIDHRVTYTALPEGGYAVKCPACGLDARSPSREGARFKARYAHRKLGVPMVSERGQDD
jgi:hypothetical protein